MLREVRGDLGRRQVGGAFVFGWGWLANAKLNRLRTGNEGRTMWLAVAGRTPEHTTHPHYLLTVYEFEERASFAAGFLLLIQECEFIVFELLEPLIPTDVFQDVFAGVSGKIDAQDTCRIAVLSSANARRCAVILLYPIADLVMISGGMTFRDRKSTRLNSSHVAISYAVFCLKKKRTAACTYL